LPAEFCESLRDLSVSHYGAITLPLPEVCVGAWRDLTVLAVVLVPEAAVYKDDLAASRKDDVWSSGKVSTMESVPVTPAMKPASDRHLGLGICATDT
jgi:hypothetical protein